MKRSIYFFTAFSIILTIGFLWSTNKNIHKDFQIIHEEVEKVSQSISRKESGRMHHLIEHSKKIRSDSSLFSNYFSLKDKAYLRLRSSELIHTEIYNTDISELLNISNSYTNLAIKSEDELLAKSYMNMALTYRIETILDSLYSNKTLLFNPELITLNEPVTYHVGKEYPINFDIVNFLYPSNYNLFKVQHQGEVIQYLDFPFVFDEAQLTQEFSLHPAKGNFHFFPEFLNTRNHNTPIIN